MNNGLHNVILNLHAKTDKTAGVNYVVAYQAGYSDALRAAAALVIEFNNPVSHGWMVTGCGTIWQGEYAELDAKAEAARCGGTCEAYEIFRLPKTDNSRPLPSPSQGNR